MCAVVVGISRRDRRGAVSAGDDVTGHVERPGVVASSSRAVRTQTSAADGAGAVLGTCRSADHQSRWRVVCRVRASRSPIQQAQLAHIMCMHGPEALFVRIVRPSVRACVHSPTGLSCTSSYRQRSQLR